MSSTSADTGSETEPYYLAVADEIEVFEAAFAARLPVLLKGPTGCGKTRFVENMAWRLSKQRAAEPHGTKASSVDEPHGTKASSVPGSSIGLTTVACHEDLTATDLVGRYLLSGEETIWMDGPLTRAVRQGNLCYLDEVVEARKDTTVVIHSLTDHRRILPIEKTSELLTAHPDFLLIISYNPGYQSVVKDLKPSTRQRFVSIEFDYPDIDVEAEIIQTESGVDSDAATRLARIGAKTRQLHERGIEEGVSTRLLVYAGMLITGGIEPRRACQSAVVHAISDDQDVQLAVSDIVDVIFP